MSQAALEFAHVGAPEVLFRQVNIGDDDAVLFRCANEHLTAQIPDAALHPVVVYAVGRSHQIYLILDGARGREPDDLP